MKLNRREMLVAAASMSALAGHHAADANAEGAAPNSARKYILWRAEFNGPEFMIVEGTSVEAALTDAGLNSNECPIEPDERVSGVYSFGDDAAFDMASPEAMKELGSNLVLYMQHSIEDGDMVGLVSL